MIQKSFVVEVEELTHVGVLDWIWQRSSSVRITAEAWDVEGEMLL